MVLALRAAPALNAPTGHAKARATAATAEVSGKKPNL
jgi:hypothetical protein